MKKLTALAACAAAMIPLQAFAAEGDTLYFANKTGYTISEIHISPTHSDDWEENVLNGEVLEDGETATIDFSESEETCEWDIQITYDDGTVAYKRGFDFCKMNKITIYYDADNDETGGVTETE